MLGSVQQLAQQSGLSAYMLQVVADYQLGGGGDRAASSLLYVVCGNAAVHGVDPAGGKAREADQFLEAVRARERALGRRCTAGEMSREAKDAAMVHEFCGWAQTRAQHFVLVYYRGGAGRGEGTEWCRASNWRPVKRDHLRYFHARLGKDLTALWRLASSDVCEDARGGLSLDVRYVAAKWCEKHTEALQLVVDHRHLLARGEDYVIKSHRAATARALRAGGEEEEEEGEGSGSVSE